MRYHGTMCPLLTAFFSLLSLDLLDDTDADNTVDNEDKSRNEETCSFYIKDGYCNKVACKKRHPYFSHVCSTNFGNDIP